MPAEFGLKREIQRVTRLLVPAQAVRLQHLRIGDGGLQVVAAVGVDRQRLPVADHLQHRLDPTPILVDRPAADLHLHRAVAHAEIAPHHLLEGRSEEHTSELQSLMRISYAVFCLKKNTTYYPPHHPHNTL